MNRNPVLLFVAASCLVASCAPLPKINTPSGKPQIVINRGVSTVKNQISSDLVQKGGTILNETSRSLRIAADMTSGNAMMYQIAMGNSYSTTPSQQYDFNFIPQGSNKTLVSARIIVVMQNAFGQSQNTDLSKGKAGVEAQGYLERTKQKLER